MCFGKSKSNPPPAQLPVPQPVAQTVPPRPPDTASTGGTSGDTPANDVAGVKTTSANTGLTIPQG